jgi:hypothetical protein
MQHYTPPLQQAFVTSSAFVLFLCRPMVDRKESQPMFRKCRPIVFNNVLPTKVSTEKTPRRAKRHKIKSVERKCRYKSVSRESNLVSDNVSTVKHKSTVKKCRLKKMRSKIIFQKPSTLSKRKCRLLDFCGNVSRVAGNG